MTTSNRSPEFQTGPPTADDLRSVQFSSASMLHPGYTDREVDDFVARAADELARLSEENAQLRAHLRDLQGQVQEAARPPSPSDQAVGILATAQLTADQYVAEAEDFSRQMTSEARAQFDELLSEARERAGAIIQAASEARAAIAGAAGASSGGPDTKELEEQAAYLKAFGQAVRTQLRAYLEALLADVETEWGKANPAILPEPPALDVPADRGEGQTLTFHSNAATEPPAPGPAPAHAVPATRSSS